MAVAEKNRLLHPRYADMKASVRSLLRTLERLITTIQQDIEALIAHEETLAKKAAILQEVKGIGRQTAAILLASLPNWEASTADRPPPWPVSPLIREIRGLKRLPRHNR
ncbi:MAG: hypothetical protein HC869_25080, partial [Rhodospirillales bacterium]|nr:hypothetical protein [Rhodospirillales bacterium]